MQQEISAVMFDRHHKLRSSAREAAIGLRYVLAALLMEVVAIGIVLTLQAIAPGEPSPLALPALILSVLAFCCGAYGTYSMMLALGWSWAVTGVVILGLLVPYAKLIVLVAVAARCFALIDKAGLRFRLFGTLKDKAPARSGA